MQRSLGPRRVREWGGVEEEEGLGMRLRLEGGGRGMEDSIFEQGDLALGRR
jgi:hypothetical protein